MLTLYTWLPTAPAAVLGDGLAPDAGHSAASFVDDDGMETYISFWPEMEGLIGRLMHPLKPRAVRNPESYEMEADQSGPYMQRPADFVDTLDGLDGRRLLAGWLSVKDLPYELKRWNCANVIRQLILMAMDPSYLGAVLLQCDFRLGDSEVISQEDVPAEALMDLAAAGLVEIKPTDLRRLVQVLTGVKSDVGTAVCSG